MSDSTLPPPQVARRRWIPVAAGTAIILTIPLGYLAFRRLHLQRNHVTLISKAPPPRRLANASSSTLATVQTTAEASPSTMSMEKTSISIRELIRDIVWPSSTPRARPPLEAVLSMVAAFGLATAAVSAGTALTVWSGMALLGVNNVHEFSYQMRLMVATELPFISKRIQNLHIYPDEDTIPDPVKEWNWEDARERLTSTYENKGALAWSEAALEEMETEARMVRFKRKKMEEAEASR